MKNDGQVQAEQAQPHYQLVPFPPNQYQPQYAPRINIRLITSMHHRTNINRNISTISTHNSNHTLREGVVETSEEEEEDLVEEEAKLRAITMDNQVTTPDIS